ncbi:MAG TPA: alpha/beta fold hydrolase [Mycobacteriales bacterium]|nr:alpha/beta fold hydrolase [Mycobacteriales bacterium]
MPPTHYAVSSRGALAYQVLGDGPPDLVMVPGLTSHLELQWQLATYRSFMRKLARHCRLIRYDKLGTGLSDPTADPPSPAERVDDLHAVITSAEAHAPVLFGFSEAGPLTIRYSLDHPVGALVLYGTSMRPPPPDYQAVLEQLLQHWGTGASLDVYAPSSAGDAAIRTTTAAIERAAASPAMVRHVMTAITLADARKAVAQVTVPTLVLHRDNEFVPLQEAHDLADMIPGAELVVVPGVDHHPWAGDQDSLLGPIAAFLDRVYEAEAPVSTHRPATPRSRTGWNALTRAERLVADRAAAGMSNPDIARDLHVARSTVETHLKRVYAKLGIDGRHQLPRPTQPTAQP